MASKYLALFCRDGGNADVITAFRLKAFWSNEFDLLAGRLKPLPTSGGHGSKDSNQKQHD